MLYDIVYATTPYWKQGHAFARLTTSTKNHSLDPFSFVDLLIAPRQTCNSQNIRVRVILEHMLSEALECQQTFVVFLRQIASRRADSYSYSLNALSSLSPASARAPPPIPKSKLDRSSGALDL